MCTYNLRDLSSIPIHPTVIHISSRSRIIANSRKSSNPSGTSRGGKLELVLRRWFIASGTTKLFHEPPPTVAPGANPCRNRPHVQFDAESLTPVSFGKYLNGRVIAFFPRLFSFCPRRIKIEWPLNGSKLRGMASCNAIASKSSVRKIARKNGDGETERNSSSFSIRFHRSKSSLVDGLKFCGNITGIFEDIDVYRRRKSYN